MTNTTSNEAQVDPRAALAAIQQRANAATDGPWLTEGAHIVHPPWAADDDTYWVAETYEESSTTQFIAASRTDVPRLVAALTAALDLADEYERDDTEHLDRFGQHHPVAYHPHPRIRAVIAAALTEEES